MFVNSSVFETNSLPLVNFVLQLNEITPNMLEK